MPINPSFAFSIMAILSLSIGSFLNVVIYRLSVKMGLIPGAKKIDFLTARSQCPCCHTKIAWYDNIPLLSFLILKGQCRSCHSAISKLYPCVEFIMLCLGLACLYRFGIDSKTLAALVLCAVLLALAVFDLRYFLLPDILTLSLLGFGLCINIYGLFTPWFNAVIGAVSAYLGLALIDSLYYLWRKQHGMGQGDWKLLAALGACLGWQAMLLTLFLASLLGVLVGLTLWRKKNLTLQSPLPFGVFLAFAGTVLLFSDGLWMYL